MGFLEGLRSCRMMILWSQARKYWRIFYLYRWVVLSRKLNGTRQLRSSQLEILGEGASCTHIIRYHELQQFRWSQLQRNEICPFYGRFSWIKIAWRRYSRLTVSWKPRVGRCGVTTLHRHVPLLRWNLNLRIGWFILLVVTCQRSKVTSGINVLVPGKYRIWDVTLLRLHVSLIY